MLRKHIPKRGIRKAERVSVRLSLLAILDQGACYGYQLRTELDRRTGGSGPINVGQVYNTLDRLERDKLVRKAGETNYYEITSAGSVAVASWFATPSSSSELAQKLALASTLPGVDTRAIVAVQRAAIPGDGATPIAPKDGLQRAAAILATARITEESAQTALLDQIEALLDLGIPPLPLSTEVPKRGRPPKQKGE